MEIIEEYSIRDAKKLLKKRNALSSCRALAEKFEKELKEKPELLVNLGFEPKEKIIYAGGNRPRFDAYSEKWKIGVEREMREQMNVRSHLLFTEIAYKIEEIEIGVYILPIEGKARFKRTVKELTEYDIFTKHFKLNVPLFLIGVE